MKTAFGRTDITPCLPVQLSGFAGVRVAREVHDPLYARVFLFDRDGEELLWVQLDLAIFDDYLMDRICEYARVTRKQLLVCSTHTHSGPGGTIDTYQGVNAGLDINLGGALNAEYCHRVGRQIGELTEQLRKDLSPGTIRITRGELKGLGTDRHDPQLPADEGAMVIEVTSGEKKAMIIRMSCHATVLNAENLMITADFPSAIEPHFPEYEQVAFVNGSAGDMSTRFTRQENTFREWERYGKLCADQLKEIMKQDAPVYDDFNITLKQKVFTTEVRKMDTPQQAQARYDEAYGTYQQAIADGLPDIEIRLIKSVWEGAGNYLASCQAFSKLDKIDVPVSVLELPSVSIFFTPTELFSKLSNPLRKYGLEHVGYSNGYLQYMPDRRAYELNYYETASTPYACGAGEKLMDAIVAWLGY